MTTVTPNYSDSLAFLERWDGQGPWVLTAIGLDGTGIETRSFFPKDRSTVLEWLSAQGAARNIYFSVNPVLGPVSKKAERTDIRALAWLHVDIDPRAGEDIAAEQQRALRVLQEPPGGLPRPTVVVFSGGGYQGFWKLAEEVHLGGDLAAAEEAKRWNLQLEVLFGADNCHNVDRIMRLPGTVNRPNTKKRQKGRTEALAEVVEWHDDRVYDISVFTKAPALQAERGGDIGTNSSTRQVHVTGNIKRYDGDIHAVPGSDKLPDKAKVVIVQGTDPDEPHKFGSSRSEWLLFACCAMVRADFDDNTIYGVITDPKFGISSSVLDKGSMTEKYAIRQIERAKEEAVDPWLRKLNERHAVISNWNGKCRVIEEQFDEVLKRYKMTRQSFEDFRNRYMHLNVSLGQNNKGVEILKPVGVWWLQHEKRRQYDKLVFAPGKEVPGAYNLWRGFACDARQGDCEPFLGHLRDNICQGNDEYFEYLIGWMARAVQHPDSPGYSAVVMRGGMGTGKSFAAKAFGSLFGRHYMQVTDPKHLVGSFNAHLRDCVVLFGEEAFYAGDKKHESILKMLITEELITIEAKGVDAEAAPNCVHLIMASNDEWVVPTAFDDRRFFVLDVGDTRKEDHSYFRALDEHMNSGGREALLHLLLTKDLSNFNVRKVPKTKALQQQKLLSMDPLEAWWFEKLRTGKLLVQHTGWEPQIACQDLVSDFINYCRQFNVSRRGSATRVGDALRRFVPTVETKQGRSPIEVDMPDGSRKIIQRPYFYVVSGLEDCRAYWDNNFGGPYDWPTPSLEDIEAPGDESDPIPF